MLPHNFEEKENKMKELYEIVDGVARCLKCDYTSASSKGGSNIRRHVETHIEGLSYTCTHCNKEFRLKCSLNTHISRSHKKWFLGPTIFCTTTWTEIIRDNLNERYFQEQELLCHSPAAFSQNINKLTRNSYQYSDIHYFLAFFSKGPFFYTYYYYYY